MFQVAPLPLTERALSKFGELFTQYLKEEIEKKQYPYGNPVKDVGDKVASGKLLNSIQYSVDVQNGDPTLVISYIDYFNNVLFGRKKERKKVPISALLDWIKIRGIRGVKRGKGKGAGRIPNLSLAFAIQTNIYKFGIRPANIYDGGLDGLLNFVDNPPAALRDEWGDVFDMIAEDVNRFLEQTINKEFPSKIE
jgi:hypothetical protein